MDNGNSSYILFVLSSYIKQLNYFRPINLYHDCPLSIKKIIIKLKAFLLIIEVLKTLIIRYLTLFYVIYIYMIVTELEVLTRLNPGRCYRFQ